MIVTAVSPLSAAEKRREGSWRLSDLRADAKEGISARYSADCGVLLLTARRTESGIESAISLENGIQLTYLRFSGDDRIVPSLEAIVEQSAQETLQAFEKSGIDDSTEVLELIGAYDDMAQELFDATASLGPDPLRYALPYHTSVVRTARRLTVERDDRTPACTPSPEYLYGTAVFRCTEDILEKRGMRGRGEPPVGPGGGGPPPIPYACGGINGSDLGCCGNYSGPCWYCHLACLAHDLACLDCAAWYCGWACVAE